MGCSMKYCGGKQKISKPLSAYLQQQLKPNQPFVDAFCGSCNIVSKINATQKIANDTHPDLIALWQHVQKEGVICLPDEVSVELYNKAKQGDCERWLRAFIGFSCSFGGKWFGGYARDKTGRNYAAEAKRSMIAKIEGTKDTLFYHGDYKNIPLPDNSLIYCDIPYKDTTKFVTSHQFNHDEFWQWVKDRAADGHDVFVSEYLRNKPDNTEVVWQIKGQTGLRSKTGNVIATDEVLLKIVR